MNTAASLNIQDDDQPAFQFSASSYDASEEGGTIVVTVTRTGETNTPGSVRYATSDGTARDGLDYTATSGTLTFAAGETSKTFAVAILADALFEEAETINLALSAPTGDHLLGSPAEAVITIADNPPPIFYFSVSSYNVVEGRGLLRIFVDRTDDRVAAEVTYSTSDGTAAAGSDYSSASGTLSFDVGEWRKTFDVIILNDLAVEQAETINLTLSNPTGATTWGAPRRPSSTWRTTTRPSRSRLGGW